MDNGVVCDCGHCITATFIDYWLTIGAALALGSIVGLVPLLLGIRRGTKEAGVLGFMLATLAFVHGGMLGGIVGAFITSAWVLLRTPRRKRETDVPDRGTPDSSNQ